MESMAGGSTSLLKMFTPDWAAVGTGLLPLNAASQKALNGPLPDSMQKIVNTQLPTLFGDYPVESNDRTASIILAVFFGVMTIANLFVFCVNQSRGHRFWVSLALAAFTAANIIGFGLRIQWAKDVLQVKVGIAAVVFLQTPLMILEVVNFYLSTRIFTWRHPQTGRSLFQRCYNGVIYSLVLALIIMAILGSSIPNLYFLTPKHYKMCQQVAQAASVLQIIYSLNSIINVMNAYLIKPGKIDERFFWGNKNRTPEDYPKIYQPTWIEKFSIFYYVPKGSQRPIFKDDPDAKNIYRIFFSENLPANGLVRSLNYDHGHPGNKSSINVMIVFVVAILLTFCSIIRCIGMFITGERGGGEGIPLKNVVLKNTMAYVVYGGVPILINIFYLVMRIDLRFYEPDRPRTRKASDPPPADYIKEDLSDKQAISHLESA